MSKLGRIARRTFLIGSAAIVGGVAFGVYAYKKDPHNPLLDDLGEGEAALTPFVKIDGNGITIITPRHDVGQGAASVQAMLLAEELDVRLDQVTLDFGQPARAYYNTGIASEGAPFAATDDSWIAESARTVVDAVMKFAAMQITGGSSTVPDAWEKMRAAGASARETLKAAAARQTGVAVADLRTADGAVILPDGSAIPYTDLAATAATVDLVRDVPLRDPADWRLIGQTVQRADTLAKATGTQTYAIDLKVEGMVHATVLLSPQRSALLSHDASAALALPGVRQVLPVTNGLAVLADTTWHAIRGAQAITAEWAPADFPAEQDAHWQQVAASFTEDFRDSRKRDGGDIDAALAGDAISAEYRAPYVGHQPMEPLSSTVLVTEDRADLWTATQVSAFAVANVARISGLKPAQVRLHNMMAGGSFGHRLETLVSDLAAEIAVQVKGTPVKLTFSREEDFTHDFPRQIAMGRMRGAVAEGRVQALDLGIAMTSPTGSQMGRLGMSVPGADPMIVAGAWDQPYAIPNYRVTGYRVAGLAPVSSWRSVGASTNAFFHDCALDELIHAAGADPMEERLRLMWHDPSRKVLEAVAEASGWGRDPGPNRGLGVAYCLAFGVPTAEVVEVEATENGIRIHDVWVAAEVGRVIDPVNFENQVQGGVMWGLGHAINGEITYAGGAIEQTNFYTHDGLRMPNAPRVHVQGLTNGPHVRGVGEPPVPPAAPALANAIFAATGQRLREMPFNRAMDFV